MKIGYYAIFNYDEYDKKEKKAGISISFPDIQECYTCSKNEEEGILMAKEVLELITVTMKVHELPKASSLDKISLNSNEKAFFISYNTEELDMGKFTFYE